MIVRNEEDFLYKCLSSIKGWVDEIIIVDTGSEDNTINIAKKFTNKVYKHKWPNDFSKVRNISLSHATKDWILVLDADEIISEEDMKKIKNLIEDNSIDGYVLTQKNYTNDSSLLSWTSCFKKSKHVLNFKGYTSSKIVRLFKNKKEYRFRNKVHELITYSIKNKNGKIINTDISIHHYSESKSKESEKNKRLMYLRIGEEQIKNNPNDERAYYETGLICLKLGEKEKALEKFKKVIDLNPSYKNIHYNLGNTYYQLKILNESIESLKKSIQKNQGINSAHNLLGIIYQSQGMYKEAIEILTEGIKIKENVLLLQNLGGIYVRLGMFDKAINLLDKALKINSNNLGVLNNLSGAYFGLKRYDDAIKTLNQIISIDKNNYKIYLNLSLIYLEKGERDKATIVLDKLVKLSPEQKQIANKILAMK